MHQTFQTKILDKYATQNGWDTETKLAIALSFIHDTDDHRNEEEPSIWEGFLKSMAERDDLTDFLKFSRSSKG